MPERFTSESTTKSQAEIFAIKKVNECGPQFASSHPQIIEDAPKITLAEIARKYNVAGLFGVTEKIALSIVKKALQVLLPAETRKELFEPRLTETKKRTGTQTLEEGIGVFGMTESEHSDAGKTGGSAARDRKKGIFKITDHEEFREAARFASKKSNEVAHSNYWFGGKIVDGMDRGTYALHLASLPEYQLAKGQFVGSPDYLKIMAAVNEKYGTNHSRTATKGFFENEKVRKRKKEKRTTHNSG